MVLLNLSRAVSIGLALALTTNVAAAPLDELQPAKKKPERLEDRLVPIPSYSPNVADNGCRARKSPNEQVATASLEIPFWGLIQHVVGPYSVWAAIRSPDEFAAKIAPLDANLRTLVLLHSLSTNMGRDGLHTYFFLSGSSIAPSVAEALKDAGLAREHGLFTRALALFGDTYPVDKQVRHDMFGYSKEKGELNDFDLRLMAIAKEFGTRQALEASIVAYVNRTPALWQRIEAERERLGEGARLEFLINELANIDLWKPHAEVKARLEALTLPQRTLVAIALFNDQFENGGVDQFFYNSEGSIAPEVRDALLEIGLERQAGLIGRGIAMFRAPYLRDTQARREAYFHNHDETTPWDKDLSALTDAFYALDGGPSVVHIGGETTIDGGPGIRHAMIAYARRNNLLPC